MTPLSTAMLCNDFPERNFLLLSKHAGSFFAGILACFHGRAGLYEPLGKIMTINDDGGGDDDGDDDDGGSDGDGGDDYGGGDDDGDDDGGSDGDDGDGGDDYGGGGDDDNDDEESDSNVYLINYNEGYHSL
jgi:hypothetical protein